MRSRGRRLARLLGGVARQSAAGVVLGIIVMLLPLPEDIDPLWLMLQAPAGALLVVCSVGKALYDTLFYDHYQP